MSYSLDIPQTSERSEIYRIILPQIRSILSDENDLVANFANVAAILKEAFNFFWVGFYRNVDDELILGPFQGPLACTRIQFGKGVCGEVAQSQKAKIISDVNSYPNHIACSSLTQSEIVLPLVRDEKLLAVLDIDSDKLDDFSKTDLFYLSEVLNFL